MLFPHLPRSVAPSVHAIESDLVLESVHGNPEPVVLVRIQLLFLYEPLERLFDQLLTRLDVVEDVLPETEKPAVQPEPRFAHGTDAADDSVVQRSDRVNRLPCPYRNEARNGVFLFARLAVSLEREVGKSIAVVCEKIFSVLEIFPNRHQAFADIRVQPCFHERDPPVADIALDRLYGPASVGENEIVGQPFGVVYEILLDQVAAVAETQDEILVPEMRVIPHEMPDDRPVANTHQGLRHRIRLLAQPGSQSAAKQHYLHALPRLNSVALRKRAPPRPHVLR